MSEDTEMSDAANIFVKEGDRGVYLYAHSTGSYLPKELQIALQKRQRWNDAPYLTRIIFDVMSAGHQGEIIGFGICAHRTEERLIIVDTDSQVVIFTGDDQEQKRYTFQKYIALSDVPKI